MGKMWLIFVGIGGIYLTIEVKKLNLNYQLKFSCLFLPEQVIIEAGIASMQTSDLQRFIKISGLWR